jgi:hypothetical protein
MLLLGVQICLTYTRLYGTSQKIALFSHQRQYPKSDVAFEFYGLITKLSIYTNRYIKHLANEWKMIWKKSMVVYGDTILEFSRTGRNHAKPVGMACIPDKTQIKHLPFPSPECHSYLV